MWCDSWNFFSAHWEKRRLARITGAPKLDLYKPKWAEGNSAFPFCPVPLLAARRWRQPLFTTWLLPIMLTERDYGSILLFLEGNNVQWCRGEESLLLLKGRREGRPPESENSSYHNRKYKYISSFFLFVEPSQLASKKKILMTLNLFDNDKKK